MTFRGGIGPMNISTITTEPKGDFGMFHKLIFAIYLIILCSPMQGLAAEPRNLSEFKLERIIDAPEIRKQYPFLINSFDELKESVKTYPEKKFGLYMAKLDKTKTGISHDLFIVQVDSFPSCGTDGCPSTIYEVTSRTKYKEIFKVTIPKGSSVYSSNCPENPSLFWQKGHRDRFYWTEWKFIDGTLEHTNPSYGDLASIHPCGFREAKAKADNRVYTYDMKGMMEEIKKYRKDQRNEFGEIQTDVTPILKKYIPPNRPKEEIFAFLRLGEFQIYKSINFDSSKYEEQFNASSKIKGPAFWHILKVIFLMHEKTIIYLNVNNGKIVDIKGEVQLQHL
jgi:hypothetical protein